MKLLFSLCCLLFFAGCASTRLPPPPRGTPLFYVKITDVALIKAPKGDTGVFFYLENYPPARVAVYEMRAGSVRSYFDGDPDDLALLMKDIAAINLIPFDFKAEAKKANDRRDARLKALGESSLVRFDTDGAEYEIGFDGPKGKFVMREWNPKTTIDDLADDSENIGKLKRLIDRFATYSGHSRLGL